MVSPAAIPDKVLFRARDIISGMLSDRSNLPEAIVTNNVRVVIYDRRTRSQADARITQAPEVEAGETGCYPTPLCNIVLIHESAHIVDYALRLEPGGQEFHSRIKNGYRVAMRAGLWRGHYASSSDNEYWAEMFRFWARLASLPCRAGQRLSFHVG